MFQPKNMPVDDFNSIVSAVSPHTLDGTHGLLINPAILNLITGNPDVTNEILPLMHFLASPASGVLMSMLGPVLSPWVQLINVVQDLIGGDWSQAFKDLLETLKKHNSLL